MDMYNRLNWSSSADSSRFVTAIVGILTKKYSPQENSKLMEKKMEVNCDICEIYMGASPSAQHTRQTHFVHHLTEEYNELRYIRM